MNRKIAFSALSIVSALTLVAGSAFAAFTTTATATGNTFSTTNPNLLIKVEDGTQGTSEPGFTESGITPGASPVIHHFTLNNADTDTGATMALTGQLNATSGDPSLEPDLKVEVICANGVDTPSDTGLVNLSDWISTAQNLGNLAPGGTANCTMAVSLPGGNTTDAHKSITFDAVFSATVGS